jgi:hypothetical protein
MINEVARWFVCTQTRQTKRTGSRQFSHEFKHAANRPDATA